MTKTLKASGREYQRSPIGAADGTIGTVYPRELRITGEFRIGNESERSHFFDTSGTPFVATHQGRFITFIADTPPADGSVDHGSELEQAWTYRIKSVIGGPPSAEVELEGFRAEFAGTGISYVIHSAFEFTALGAAFPEDKGPTGLDTDGVNRSNTAPTEWQVLHFPEAADDRLQMYPFLIGLRVSATALRVSDPFDNIETFPTPVTDLQWHLRDRPAYTHEQLYKIIHQFMLHCGWQAHQHRGKNNGAGTGGNSTSAFLNCVQDWIYFSDGEAGDQAQYLRFAAFHRMNITTGVSAGTDAQGDYGFDWAFFSAWDRSFAPINLGFGATNTIFSNNGNGVNALSSHFSTSVTNRWAAQCDVQNSASNNEPGLSPDSFSGALFGTPLHMGTKWGSPYHAVVAAQSLRPNTLNTFEGGSIQEIRYFMFGDKDEVQLYLEAPGVGYFHIGLGNLQARADANGNSFKTNFKTDSSLGTPRLHIGGPGTADGTDPTGTTPPYQVGDRIQTVGQVVAAGLIPGTSHNGEFIESSTITALPGLTPAIGTIDCITKALHVDNTDVFTIDTGAGNVQFYYDVDGLGGGIGTAIDISLDTTAIQVATRTVGVLNASALLLTASNTGGTSARIDLIHDTNGGVGNIAMTEAVANAGFVIDGMDGGGHAIDIAALNNDLLSGALVGEDPQSLFFFLPTFKPAPFSTSPSQGTFRVSNRSNFVDATYRDHNGPGGTPGGDNSNGFNALAELSGLSGADIREVNPNQRSGRFSAMTVNCKDTTGGQLRGSMRYFRAASPYLGAYQMKRDRNGDWHLILPLSGKHDKDLISGLTTDHMVAAIGPIPTAMAFVG